MQKCSIVISIIGLLKHVVIVSRHKMFDSYVREDDWILLQCPYATVILGVNDRNKNKCIYFIN